MAGAIGAIGAIGDGGCHRFEASPEHRAGMAVHAFMSAVDDVRRLSDDQVRESEGDLRLTVAILLARLGRLKARPDTS